MKTNREGLDGVGWDEAGRDGKAQVDGRPVPLYRVLDVLPSTKDLHCVLQHEVSGVRDMMGRRTGTNKNQNNQSQNNQEQVQEQMQEQTQRKLAT